MTDAAPSNRPVKGERWRHRGLREVWRVHHVGATGVTMRNLPTIERPLYEDWPVSFADLRDEWERADA